MFVKKKSDILTVLFFISHIRAWPCPACASDGGSMFLENSQDFLYIVLSLSILWFTVFLCWLLYQAARVLKNANAIMEQLSHKLELITDAIEFIRKKVDNVSTHMGVVSGMLSGLVEKYVVGKLTSKFEEKINKKDPPSKIKKK
ncbi:MAG TPA: hypothetical protein DCY48_01185 [Candidatus Magasanikbacteria bacterium]|nr:MAG: hypothetical protein A3I74_03655 [Candidatus Magasanikbacteria bacterium RIFCSPLOWO2_02_FULL_47_16]OGH80173.1 MAG: hypothetical protein A3C10_03240 [Candidatus Magasanikbacteria bacterium RIFCSPHIGHO2_02_FULL_48_18]OGH82857.1 MAG: hypothetical protein A3G08_02785 [Candidatus Magasanikbacteria bacterium RIFCSPLOWO2_12_FULL_47_9b]HAZ28371.1 hypothetical protein [Candidatus Magasanikbacteria bacterium]